MEVGGEPGGPVGSLALVDYEFAGASWRGFDLANILCEAAIDNQVEVAAALIVDRGASLPRRGANPRADHPGGDCGGGGGAGRTVPPLRAECRCLPFCRAPGCLRERLREGLLGCPPGCRAGPRGRAE